MRFDIDEIRFFSSRMPPVPDPRNKTAMIQFKNDGDLDTVKELEDAIGDLDNAVDNRSSSGYENKIKRSLLAVSVNDQDFDEAKKEWGLHKKWVAPNGKCELCGHWPIVYHFQIKNKHNHNTLVLGSECILNYVVVEGFTKDDLKRYLNRLRKRLKDRRFDAVEAELLDVWDKQDEVFNSLKKLVAKLDADFDIAKYYRRISRLSYAHGFKLKEHLQQYSKNVRVMSSLLDRTYGTTELAKVPDKIQRKQKLNREKVTDQKKLELFIEFETQLKLLLKYGTPAEALSMMMADFEEHVRGQLDDVDTQKALIVADITRWFGQARRDLGTRSRLKDYVDSWQDQWENKVTEEWSDYESRMGDIDGLLAGRTRMPDRPSTNGDSYIQNYSNHWSFPGGRAEYPLFAVLMKVKVWTYSSYIGWNSSLPKDHPIRTITSIDGNDLQASILDCVNRDEIPKGDIARLQINGDKCQVTADWVATQPKLMERLATDSADWRKAIKAAEEQAATRQKQLDETEKLRKEQADAATTQLKKDEQEYSDLIKDAEAAKDPNNDWEKRFVADMARKYKVISSLSPKMVLHLRRIAQRTQVPQPTPSQNNKARQTQVPAGAKTVDFKDFIEACKTTMHAGREAGFVNSILRRYKTSKDVSDRQMKWLLDIYKRSGNAAPDHIS